MKRENDEVRRLEGALAAEKEAAAACQAKCAQRLQEMQVTELRCKKKKRSSFDPKISDNFNISSSLSKRFISVNIAPN